MTCSDEEKITSLENSNYKYMRALDIIETYVDKIRYSGDSNSERLYINKLLNWFCTDSGDFKFNELDP